MLGFWVRKKSDFVNLTELTGKRPLRICVNGERVLYGEYRSNDARTPVRIMISESAQSWRELIRLGGVRHIHSITYDSGGDCYWICTGDDDHESRLYRLDGDLKRVEIVSWGDQLSRFIAVLPFERHLLLATDTPFVRNRILLMDKASSRMETLGEVAGSVFWGNTTAHGSFFSTACEPSAVNDTRQAFVYRVTADLSLRRMAQFKKDRMPMKLGQYGQLRLPATGSTPDRNLFSTFSVRPHGEVYEMEFPDSQDAVIAASRGPAQGD